MTSHKNAAGRLVLLGEMKGVCSIALYGVALLHAQAWPDFNPGPVPVQVVSATEVERDGTGASVRRLTVGFKFKKH